MSAITQFSATESEALSTADSEIPIAAPVSGRDDPLQLLREVIASLNSSKGDLPDQAQVANLLTEAREALERASLIARTLAQCQEFVVEAEFERAFQSLDAGLQAYPGDATLVARRVEVEERQKAFLAAAATRAVLEEAQWLLDQDRPDLAAQFLKEKAVDLPDRPALISRLEAVEALLPQWEKNRNVRTALERAAALEQLEQRQAALTILEEALQSYPASEELTIAVTRVRQGLADRERGKRLARRLKLIGQKIETQSWRPALALIEDTQREFPKAPELDSLRREVDASLRQSEREAVVTEVRQFMADGELELAEQALSRGMESLGPEPALEALRVELRDEAKYQEELRAAQILFGRRQLREAESVLAGLVAKNRPEAQALLEAVRQARTVSEEVNFCERGREKALQLMQQQQFAQAIDLLNNLLTLFPGNPILERDLVSAQDALGQESSKAVAVTGQESGHPEEPESPRALTPSLPVRLAAEALTRPADREPVRVSPHSRVRRAAIVGTASLLLVSAGGAAWRLSRRGASAPVQQLPAASPLPDSGQARRPRATPEKSSTPTPARQPIAATSTVPSESGAQPQTRPERPLRPFVQPGTQQEPVQSQGSGLPLPPGTALMISAETVLSLPAELGKPVNAPARPQAAAAVSTQAPKPAAQAGGNAQEAQLLNRELPDYPAMARQRGILGVVQMEAMIDEHGTVMNVKVVSGDAILAAAARSAVLRWKYKPAILNGRPIASSLAVRVSFQDRNK